MINLQTAPRYAFLLSFIFLFISCQEDTSKLEFEPVDEDMIAATLLVEDYLNSLVSSGAKGKKDDDAVITVLRYKDGEVLFSTKDDDIKGYDGVDEETVTAEVEPGDLVFWYRGAGMSDLDGLEFEESSDPDELKDDKLWMLEVPDFDLEDDEVVFLKYDILYTYRGYTGPAIRLDPKLKVTQ